MATRGIQDDHRKLEIHRAMEVRRDAYLDYMTFQTPGPPLFTEIFGPLLGLKEEWLEQGATPEELDFSVFRYRRPMAHSVSANTRWMGGPKEEILEETEDHILGTDRYGRTVKLFKQSGTIPLPLTHPVETMDDWVRVKSHYQFSESRFGRDWKDRAEEARERGLVIRVGIPGGFDEPRQLLGEALLCESYYSQPEMIHDMLDTIGEMAFRVLERVSAEVPVDLLHVHEDMAGKSGPLAGPRQVEEFIHPYYRRIWDMLQDRGARLFSQDSDGDMNSVIPAFLEAGINLMYPIEPAAGMDLVKIREQYGTRLAMTGGLDKHVVRRTREEIEAELEYKIPPMIRSGGCELGLDHRIPNGTPLENYRFYVDKAWEIIDREWEEIGR
jgi:hypothetical protein